MNGQRARPQRVDEQRADEQRVDEQRADEQRADEQRAEKQRARDLVGSVTMPSARSVSAVARLEEFDAVAQRTRPPPGVSTACERMSNSRV